MHDLATDSAGTPSYYQRPAGDLYDLWHEHYGQEVAAQHLELCALEYLWRCRQKGQYRSDLEKVQVIVARLLAWEREAHP